MTYMNGQQDVLTGPSASSSSLLHPQLLLNPAWLAIVRHRTSHLGHLGDIHIISLSPTGQSLTLLIHPPPNCDSLQLELPFDPPIKDPYLVRPRLYKWRDQALAHFSVVSHSNLQIGIS
jgi:hypothetical protein